MALSRISAGVLVGALVVTPVLGALSGGIPGLGWWCLGVVAVAGLVAAVALFRATATTGRAPFVCGASGAAAVVAGLLYFASVADEPGAIPIAGLGLLVFGLAALAAGVSTVRATSDG